MAELDGPRFFRLARRVFAFRGVMAVRQQQLAEEQPPAPQQHQAPPQPPAPQQDSNVVPLNQFAAMYPWLVSHTEGR